MCRSGSWEKSTMLVTRIVEQGRCRLEGMRAWGDSVAGRNVRLAVWSEDDAFGDLLRRFGRRGAGLSRAGRPIRSGIPRVIRHGRKLRLS